MADVSTDKLFTQITSTYNGKVHKLFYKEEEACLVGDPLLEIEVEGAGAATAGGAGHGHQQPAAHAEAAHQPQASGS